MDHRFALVTGASSGIGEEFARALPTGTGLLLTGREEARLLALRDELAAGGRPVEAFVADLGTDAGREEAIRRAEAHAVDLFICNAGLGALGRLLDITPEREREMVEVNVVTPVVLVRALLPGMIARARADGGRAGVIVLASVAGFMTLPFFTTYSATKAFDLHYAEALANELKDEPVDVLALCPGATRTRFGERAGMPGKVFENADSAKRVAQEGLAALGRRKVHVVGGLNRLNTMAPRLLPRNFLAGQAARVMASLSRKARAGA